MEVNKYGSTDNYGYDVKGDTRASICYQLPGGFAEDLLSIKMFGQKTSGTFLHIETGGKNLDFSGKAKGNIKIIESDGLSNDKDVLGVPSFKTESLDDMIKKLNKEYLEKNKKN